LGCGAERVRGGYLVYSRATEAGERKGGGPRRGGERGGRAHGPALGGEAGSVLIEKLIRIGLSYRP